MRLAGCGAMWWAASVSGSRASFNNSNNNNQIDGEECSSIANKSSSQEA